MFSRKKVNKRAAAYYNIRRVTDGERCEKDVAKPLLEKLLGMTTLPGGDGGRANETWV